MGRVWRIMASGWKDEWVGEQAGGLRLSAPKTFVHNLFVSLSFTHSPFLAVFCGRSNWNKCMHSHNACVWRGCSLVSASQVCSRIFIALIRHILPDSGSQHSEVNIETDYIRLTPAKHSHTWVHYTHRGTWFDSIPAADTGTECTLSESALDERNLLPRIPNLRIGSFSRTHILSSFWHVSRCT